MWYGGGILSFRGGFIVLHELRLERRRLLWLDRLAWTWSSKDHDCRSGGSPVRLEIELGGVGGLLRDAVWKAVTFLWMLTFGGSGWGALTTRGTSGRD